MELWDAYDADWQPTGETLVRGEPIPPGRYHLVAEVLLRGPDGRWLLMRRSEDRPYAPGMWEASAGGSALRGEDAARAALREVREETGLPAEGLEPVFRARGDGWLFVYFLARTDRIDVQLQSGETADWRWVGTAELRRAAEADELMHAWMLRSFLDRIEP